MGSRLEGISSHIVPEPLTPKHYVDLDLQFIGGSWVQAKGRKTLRDVNPYNGDLLAEITLSDKGLVDEAYQQALKAQSSWEATLPSERRRVLMVAARIMEARQPEIIEWLVRESGSTRIKAKIEWQMLYGITLEAASFPYRQMGRILPIDEPGKESRAYRHAVGVVGVISPWNFPIYLSQRSVAPAIAVGNAVVLKPASDTPVTGGLLLAKIFEEAGLPPGVLNVVVGESEEIGDAFAEHPVPRLISFTGSTAVGKHVGELAMKGPTLKRTALELGGNSPFVVLDDADLEQAVRGAIFSRFCHQGQICMSSNRLIIDTRVYDEFLSRFTGAVEKLRYGNPDDEDTVIGPVINEKQLTKMLQLITESKKAGARQVLGGDPEGLVLPPHVFADVQNESPIARNETFGPIAPLIRVSGEEEALKIANDTPFGLSSAVYTRDEARGLRFAQRVEAGMTHVNGSSVDDTPTGPFGGEKNSGIGRFGGEWILEELTTVHWISLQHAPTRYPF